MRTVSGMIIMPNISIQIQVAFYHIFHLYEIIGSVIRGLSNESEVASSSGDCTSHSASNFWTTFPDHVWVLHGFTMAVPCLTGSYIMAHHTRNPGEPGIFNRLLYKRQCFCSQKPRCQRPSEGRAWERCGTSRAPGASGKACKNTSEKSEKAKRRRFQELNQLNVEMHEGYPLQQSFCGVVGGIHFWYLIGWHFTRPFPQYFFSLFKIQSPSHSCFVLVLFLDPEWRA